MYNLCFPREICYPKRVVVGTLQEFVAFINRNTATSNLYTNVYNYLDVKENRINYQSAKVDRLYFDIDKKVRDGKEEKLIDAYEHMMKLHTWCLENEIIHFPRCTGTAYDIIIATDPDYEVVNKKMCVANAQTDICKQAGIIIDKQVVGDIARIHRIDNTFNHKPTTQRFCIPLDKEIIYGGEQQIFEAAKKQRFTNNWYGKKYLDISVYDTEETKYEDFLGSDTKVEIKAEELGGLLEMLPPCVLKLLSKGDINWTERRIVILSLRDNCFTYEECVLLLKRFLTPKKFNHCINEEQQVKHLYQNQKYLFPTQQSIKDTGWCQENGSQCKNAKLGCLMYDRSSGI